MALSEDVFILQLRIGNLVIDQKGNIKQVCLISLDIDDEYLPLIEMVDIGKSSNATGDIIRNIQPIPLTEEWIIKLGLNVGDEFVAWGVRTKCTHTYLSGGLYLVKKDENKWSLGISNHESAHIEIEDGGDSQNISYVHQLQNLYFALTGEELGINE